MNEFAPLDESLLRRLPLPLAQLAHRAHNAQTALDRHLTAFYLWEAALKLLSMAAVVAYARQGTPNAALTERLKNLARPALGHWWEFVRLLVPWLADRGQEPYRRMRELLLGRSRDDLPHAAGLDAVLLESRDGKASAQASVRLKELFDRLVEHRNKRIGHGIVNPPPDAMDRRLGTALLAGVTEILDRLDVLAGQRLLYLGDVRQSGGVWLVERFELTGATPRRIASLEVPRDDLARLPDGERLYLAPPDAEGLDRLTPLHPLLVYDADAAGVLFLNARRGRQRAEYLNYTNGRTTVRADWDSVRVALLAQVLGTEVRPEDADAWAVKLQADEGPVEEAASPTPRLLGDFELLSELGRGGMGVVYRAWQPSLGRQVAMKKLLRSGDTRAEARFRREIHALGQVEHPNLVKVFTSGSDGDNWFYAMELIEGADLATICSQLANSLAPEVSAEDWTNAVSSARERQRQQEKPLSEERPAAASQPPASTAAATAAPRSTGKAHIEQVVEVVRQVAEAAHALHEVGVIHRDIKPGNILLSAEDGRAVLMDLGLAQLIDDSEGRLTQTRQFVGTLRYASPEQILSARLDARTDVYSLGATLWELLTLRPLYGVTEQTPTPDLMYTIQTAESEKVRKYNPRVPRDLETIVMKCLSKDRTRRYVTAAELAADLDRWQRGEPVQAQPPSLGYLLRKKLRRYRVPVSVAAFVLLAAAVGVIAAFVQISVALEGEKNANILVSQQKKDLQEALEKKNKAQVALKAQLSQAARAYCDRGDLELRMGNDPESLIWMLRAYETAKEANDPLESSYRRHLAVQSRALGHIFVHEGAVSAVAFSPDGRTVLTASHDQTARLWDAATGKPVGDPLRHKGAVQAAKFSPDGRSVLTGSADKTARLWDAATGKPLGESLRHEDAVVAVAFSPDGRSVLTGSWDKTARLWDAATGKPVGSPLRHKDAVMAVAFSPDGRTVLTGSEHLTAQLWNVATGKPVGAPLRHAGKHGGNAVTAVAFSPDGRTVLTGCADWTAQLWNAKTGQPLAEPLELEGDVRAVAFSPDGRTALTGSGLWLGLGDRTARLWDAATGKPVGEEMRHPYAVLDVAFSPDGRTVVTGSADKTARLWSAATGEPIGEPLRHDDEVRAVAFSPDGRIVITGSKDKTARLWDAATGQPVGGLLGETDFVHALAFSPDGRMVVTGSEDKTERLLATPTGTAQLWDIRTGKPRGEPMRHQSVVNAVAFSPDGRTLLTGYGDFLDKGDKGAQLWDLVTGRPRGQPLSHKGRVTVVAFSPDGRTALTGSEDKTARLWGATTGQPDGKPLGHQYEVKAVAFSPDGSTVLTASVAFRGQSWLHSWNATTGEPVGEPRYLEGDFMTAAFSLDSRTVVTGGEDNTARLWDTATGKPRGEPLRLEYEVETVAFSPDGRSVFTGTFSDKWPFKPTARLWDTTTGKPLGKPFQMGNVKALAFSSDSRSMITSERGAVLLWEIVAAAPDDLPRVGALVRVRTGKAFDDQGVLRPLTQVDWLQAWKELETSGGDWEPKPSGRCWHFFKADALSKAGEAALSKADEATLSKYWFAVDFHMRRFLAEVPNRAEPFPAAERLVELAERLQKSNPDSAAALEILGAARFRAGDYAEAVKRLNAPVEKQPKGRTVWTQLFLAMAHYQLGDAAQAKDWLQQADAQMKKRQEDKNAIPNWQERLRDQKLRQEAADLLKSPPPARPKVAP